MPSIFDNVARVEDGYSLQGEQAFAYLNRSGRPLAGKIRAMLDTWVGFHPAEGREELITRLRGGDTDHESAFFELMLHELARRAGHKIIEAHPQLSGTTKRPEFKIEAPNGKPYILEALMVTGRTPAEALAETRIKEAIRVIEQIHAPHHYLMIGHYGAPTNTLPLGQLSQEFAAYVAQLQPGVRGPEFVFLRHGLRLRVRTPPRAAAAAPGTRSLGGISPPARYRVDSDDMKRKVKGKLNKYGALGMPYVIAVNRFSPTHKTEDLVDLLFGDPLEEGAVTTSGYLRRFNGLLLKPSGPLNTRLSAALGFEGVTAWQLPLRRGTLVLNPWAAHAAAFGFNVDVCSVSQQGVATTVAGQSLADIFDVADQEYG